MNFSHTPLPDDPEEEKELPDDGLPEMGDGLDDDTDEELDDDDEETIGFDRFDDVDEF